MEARPPVGASPDTVFVLQGIGVVPKHVDPDAPGPLLQLAGLDDEAADTLKGKLLTGKLLMVFPEFRALPNVESELENIYNALQELYPHENGDRICEAMSGTAWDPPA